MNSSLHFVGLSGSLRKGSYNTSVLNASLSLLHENVTMEIASIAGISYLSFPSIEDVFRMKG